MPPKKKVTKPPKKTAAKPKPKRASKPKPPPEPITSNSPSFLRAFIAIAILAVIVIVVLLGIRLYSTTPPPKQKQPTHKAPAVVLKKIPASPVFEVFPKEEPKETIPHPEKKIRPPAINNRLENLVCIIIDDFGYDYHVAADFVALKSEITFSILPHSPFRYEIAELAHDEHMEILLHLPMEPFNYPKADPGPGALFQNMAPDQLISQLNQNLESVPYIAGVNNHMGSKITSNEPQIHQIFSILKKQDLFFIDSRTTNKSICRSAARLFRLPFAERSVFLDNRQDKVEIQKQLIKLVEMAEKKGEAVGIGHAYQITCDVLKNQLPWIKSKVTLVPASRIVHVIETQI